MAPTNTHLLRGTLDLLILKSLCWGPRHGYAVAEWIEATTNEHLRIVEGTIYPALHRMAKRDWIESEWGPSDNNRRAKFYTLTNAGKKRLQEEVTQWQSYSIAMNKVIHAVTSDAPAMTKPAQ